MWSVFVNVFVTCFVPGYRILAETGDEVVQMSVSSLSDCLPDMSPVKKRCGILPLQRRFLNFSPIFLTSLKLYYQVSVS